MICFLFAWKDGSLASKHPRGAIVTIKELGVNNKRRALVDSVTRRQKQMTARFGKICLQGLKKWMK